MDKAEEHLAVSDTQNKRLYKHNIIGMYMISYDFIRNQKQRLMIRAVKAFLLHRKLYYKMMRVQK